MYITQLKDVGEFQQLTLPCAVALIPSAAAATASGSQKSFDSPIARGRVHRGKVVAQEGNLDEDSEFRLSVGAGEQVNERDGFLQLRLVPTVIRLWNAVETKARPPANSFFFIGREVAICCNASGGAAKAPNGTLNGKTHMWHM
jgi:hypothetical protein